MMLVFAAVPPLVGAAALDAQDQGKYVVLDENGRPTSTLMHYFLNGSQWMMDGKLGNGKWLPVCRDSDECRLGESSDADVTEWRSRLPPYWHKMPFACINNKAFAFCRVTNPANAERRAYWWFVLTGNQVRPLPINRLE